MQSEPWCMRYTNTKRPRGALVKTTELGLANLGDVDRVRAFFALCDLELQGITFAKFVEGYAAELLGVEEDVLLLTFDFDETEAFVRELLDFSCLHMHWGIFL
jgi:hypothetical protein